MNIKYKSNTKKKGLILFLSLVMIIFINSNTTQSYFTSTPAGVYSNLTKGFVETTLEQNYLDENITNIRVRNNGNVPAYIRVALIVNWETNDNTVLGESPVKDTDYSIVLKTEGVNPEWFDHEGIYYYKEVVQPQEYTEDLISSLKLLKNKENYNLVVKTLTSGIQALPSSVVTEVWDMEVKKETLVKPELDKTE